eukprot:TRINITY_DN2402_c0_g1_i3.p1 TRINITY_DN2402_c0_g1~~TRINITY_DN2402_c0_g1_i3.p1  ORF type:complete len:183 (-),score=41.36 TRINITY_DN2402_c0_g1_i3:86-604(-)
MGQAEGQTRQGYLIGLDPIEDSYEGDSLDYRVILQPLGMSIEQWFKLLWAQPQDTMEDWILSQCGLYPMGLGTVCMTDNWNNRQIPPNPAVADNFPSLCAWLNENLKVEGAITVRPNSISYLSNREFDGLYCFCYSSAASTGELNPLISSLYEEIGGQLVRKVETHRGSAYL